MVRGFVDERGEGEGGKSRRPKVGGTEGLKQNSKRQKKEGKKGMLIGAKVYLWS